MRVILALLLFLSTSFSAMATEKVVLGLSQNRVSITANFDGSEILVFGAVKRETPLPKDEPLGVIVVIEGPSAPIQVRRKEKRLGIWVNAAMVKVDQAPAYYAIATSGPFNEVLNNIEDQRHRVSIPRAIRAVGLTSEASKPEEFVTALIRIRSKNGLYQVREGAVDVAEETLFKTSVALPANLVEGAYKARVFLTRKGAVVANYSTEIDVRKVGLERFLFNLSRERPLIYGLLSLSIAIFAGWAASAFFRIFRNS